MERQEIKKEQKDLNRRSFLKKTALGLVIFSLGSALTGSKAEGYKKENEEKSLVMNMGPYGTFRSIKSGRKGISVISLMERNQIEKGTKTLQDLKRFGDSFSFQMPLPGILNSYSGEISVDSEVWNPGNPSSDKNGNIKIDQGQVISLSFEAENEDNEFEIYFNDSDLPKIKLGGFSCHTGMDPMRRNARQYCVFEGIVIED